MFDLSSDIIIPNFDMLDNNSGDYYYNYNEMETNYEMTFDDYDTPGGQVMTASSNLMTSNYNQQIPQYTNVSATPSMVSTTNNSVDGFTFNNYANPNLNSENLNLNNQSKPEPAHYGSQNNLNHLSVNVNLSTLNNETNFSTPNLTPQIQSPNHMMYPAAYDLVGNSYHEYAPQSHHQPPLSAQSSVPYDFHRFPSPLHAGPESQLTQYQLQQHQHQHSPVPASASAPSRTTVMPMAHSPSSTSSATAKERKNPENKIITSKNNDYRVVRGIAAGGSHVRPPKSTGDSDSTFVPIELNLMGGSAEEICHPAWSSSEKEDRRRIVRIERIQKGPKIIANFSIVGSANENPTVLPPPPNFNVDVIEVSCLECTKKLRKEEEEEEDDHDDFGSANDTEFDYYITSVEVIEIVELLIRTMSSVPSERRKERGRVRSNLVPFWAKKPISSRIDGNVQPDYRVELAKRIMGYEIRKPRGFDKEVRILRWDKLMPALRRALQCYYCEIPHKAD
ncbi:hypothetical protein PSN45_004694 [Yamadazyma tenuis]|uniref:DUF7082 domain-containing protein n=1 Tax=Candida tenuis (strain ATCC 10573 / BCRC 21748 / CBS 615 / JCM 9827 / NBRC 10315 / NRRL Y-1498 / VKM Y-70) TaxID=590646 RepID=G3B6W6_CANTC|nr:uncharacterized protein CANTEDRAFT_93810 [Yamadazyma tenuis ATCC 10573]EGV63038.1 hypothetical protein CANTEDRAFT_93810 [Yamadazyma tenuis ATCC 10573]WEJ97146.1 hypothetical protein PSN45_004694 [Yamadazyma tenuis]